MSEITRIRQDLQRAKDRVAAIRAGQRGVRPAADWRAGDDADGGGRLGAARAYGNQLLAQEQTVTRLENELLLALLAAGTWSAAAIIERMTAPPIVQTREPSDVDVREALLKFISNFPNAHTVSVAELQEFLQQ